MTILSDLGFSIVNGLIFGSLLAMTSIGLSLIFGTMNVPNFAQGEFAAFAGFATIGLIGLGLGVIPSILLGLVLSFVIGVLFERLLIAPLYDYDLEQFFLLSFFISFGILLAFEEFLRVAFRGNLYQIPSPSLGTFALFGSTLNIFRLLVGILALLSILVLYLFTRYTDIGLAMRAIADDRRGAQIVGIDSTRIYRYTFGIGALITGFSGILYGMIFSLSPQMGLDLTAFAFVIVVLGGVGSFPGTLIASLLIGIVDSLTATFLGSRYRLIMVFIILLVALILFPTGLIGGESE